MWSFSFAQQYTNISIKNGLPSNHVYRITQDYQGFIWFITDKGMVKFDGETLKTFTTKDGLPTNDIWQVNVTPDNKIWFFSKSNMLGYIKDDIVHSYASKNNKVFYPRDILQVKNKIHFNDGKINYQLKDSLWVPTKNPILNETVFKRKVIHPIINYHSVNKGTDSILFHKKNSVIGIAVPKKLLEATSVNSQINDSLYINVCKNYYILENFNAEKVHVVSYASQNLQNNTKYFRSHNVNNNIQFTGMNFVSFLGPNGHLKNTIHIPEKINAHFSFLDNNGNIWSATFNRGVFMLPKEKQKVPIIGKGKKVQKLHLFNNKLYAAIYNEGIFLVNQQPKNIGYNSENIFSIKNKSNSERSLYPILKNSGFQYSISTLENLNTLIFSSEYNISAYKDNTVTKINFKREAHKKNSFARKLIEFKGDLYGNNAFGIIKLNPENYAITKQYKLFGISSFSKTNTQLFTGNQAGLFTYKSDAFVKLNQAPLFKKPILCQVQLSNNAIVVGTDGYGAYTTNGSTTKIIKDTENYSVQSIFIDNSAIWLATEKGVHKAVKNGDNYEVNSSFYESDGLLSNKTNSIVVKNDSLFAASDIGISVLSLKKKQTNQLQKLYIKSVFNNDISYKGDSISFDYKKNNNLSVSFGSIDFSNQQNLSYEYRLKPIQKKWTKIKTTTLNFSDLAPKEYELALKVSNHHNQSISKTIVITVVPLWYQTWLFKAILLLFSMVMIYYLNQWNKKRIEVKVKQKAEINQKLAQQELYALRSQMNPHFVFNSLNAIQYYITKNEKDLSEKYLVKFARLVRMFFDFSERKSITLQEEINLLNGYLEMEKMRFGSDFHYHFKIDENIDLNTHIPTMLLQPIVENAVNHGIFHNNRKGIVTIMIQYINQNEFRITIKDNGVGFKKAKEIRAQSIKTHKSKSTQITKDRILLINHSKEWEISQKTIHLNKHTETGTSVILNLKKLN